MLQPEDCELPPDAKLIDGVVYYEHKGKLETQDQRDARIEKNTYMCFSRSLQSALARSTNMYSSFVKVLNLFLGTLGASLPPEVFEVAKNRKHRTLEIHNCMNVYLYMHII